MTGELDLSIIIVNWNSLAYLRGCLASLLSIRGIERFETIVIDNASRDACVETLQHEFAWVRCIASKVNLGFAAANNLGFSLSRGRNVLFLNPDTEVFESAISELAAAISSIQDAGIVGARLLNSDLTLQTSCLQSFPTIMNQMLDSEFIRSRTQRSRLWGNRAAFESPSGPVAVDVISGACMMVKREAFEGVRGFSSGYFMYSEDVDLCLRVRKAGWRCYYVGQATVVHHGGCSSKKAPRENFGSILMRESRYRLFTRWRGKAYARLYRVSVIFGASSRLTLLAMALVASCGFRDCRNLKSSARKWLAILRWALGLEPWAARLK